MRLHIPMTVFLGIAVIACCSAGCVSQSPKTVKIRPRSSETNIRNTILAHTPLGSSQQQVLDCIGTRLRHEDKARIDSNTGARKRTHLKTDSGLKYAEEIIGVKSIVAEVGWHWAIFPFLPAITYVYVYWAFDENDRLIDVIVYKEIDSI